jgi:hypothetical protein
MADTSSDAHGVFVAEKGSDVAPERVGFILPGLEPFAWVEVAEFGREDLRRRSDASHAGVTVPLGAMQ